MTKMGYSKFERTKYKIKAFSFFPQSLHFGYFLAIFHGFGLELSCGRGYISVWSRGKKGVAALLSSHPF